MLDYGTIASEAMQLPIADQLRLIDQLAALVPDDRPPTLSDDWLTEIDRRSKEVDAGAVTMESWDSIRTRIFKDQGVDGAN